MRGVERGGEWLEVLDGRVIGLFGLAFKPNTDDLREAPSIEIAKVLLAAGAAVRAYDPAAMEGSRRIMPDIEYMSGAYETAAGADAVVVVTQWNEFRYLHLGRMNRPMTTPVRLDPRNTHAPP